MATNITIPVTTLTVAGSPKTFGPFNMNKEQNAVLTIDRTVAGGLNSLTSATTLEVDLYTSPDNGVTWIGPDGFSTTGGIITDRNGQTATTNTMSPKGLGGQGTRVKVVTTVIGPSDVVVAGSLVLSG